jgi:hypothetical protein
MSKIVRYEYLGSWAAFILCCVTIVLIPMALLMLINSTVRIENSMEDPEAFMEAYRAGRAGRR